MNGLRIEQLHIDVVRNATDDFNPFHDPHRWRNIRENPFGGTIALGFQLEALAIDRIAQFRQAHGCADLASLHGLHFSNDQFTFASAVTAGSEVAVQVRRTVNSIQQRGEISNRVTVKHLDGRLALMGMHKDTRRPQILPDGQLDLPDDLRTVADRSQVSHAEYFLKRKYLTASNGKNFCAGSLIPQHHYFDELAEKVYFPPSFTLSLVSCALLERAWQQGHDFEKDPYVYTTHAFSVDNRLQRGLRSNDRVHLLVSRPIDVAAGSGQIRHACFAVLDDGQVLFRGLVGLAPLGAILAGGSS